ncbi:hypothetical protein DFJ73DRAFT_766453 [Zopfochytrium polystomum]|nr:hypothetical protein DFJ73DRAFT_766453 [Zopfochytrium polystomum]
MQDLQTTQRKEYREFVVKVYEELKARSSHTQASEPPPPTPARPPLSRKPSWTDVSGGNQSRTLSRSTSQDLFFGKASPSGGRTGDGTAVVTAAIRKLEKRPSQEILSLDSKSQPLDKMGAAADPESLKKTKEIEDMGFTKEQAVAALDLSGRNLEEAIMLLLEQPERIAERISFVQNEARKPLSPSPSLSNLRRPFSGSATPWNSTPRFPSRFLGTSGSGSSTPNTESVPAGGRRGFSPLAFIQQQQQKLVATTASSQGLKRMSSFLGKAMEALGMEDLERGKEVNDFADLSETFTTYFGTQVRTIAQTAASLYSESLCGVILVIRAKEVMKGYASGKGGSKGLIQQCKRTTEFHFDDFETQMKAIEMKFKRNNEGSPILREGDFFITKHSNIPRIHVVFHLVIEEESIKDLNPRSAILTGYRNILKIAQQCDVNDITVPILLLPTGGDPFAVVSLTPSSNMPGNGSSLPPPSPLNSPTPTFSSDASLLKRAELVLKATKGQLMEQSWATKHAGDSSGVDKKGKAIQFGLQVEALGAGRGAWAVEELFAGGRERLMEVFKTT